MDNRSNGRGPLKTPHVPDGAIGSGQLNKTDSQTMKPAAEQIRAARAKAIEETAYRLTDLFATISGRIEILSDTLPSPCREELLALRRVAMKGAELNRRLLLAAQECRSEIGL